MSQIKYSRTQGARLDGSGDLHMFAMMCQDIARNQLVGQTALTDNTGGAAPNVFYSVPTIAIDFKDGAATGSDRVSTAGATAAFTAVLDGLREINAQAVALGAKVGVQLDVYNAGGAAPDGTLAAIPDSGAGSATGCTAAALNPTLNGLVQAFYDNAVVVNRVAVAVGVHHAKHGEMRSFEGTTPAEPITVGAANAVSVSKADFDAKMVLLRNAVSLLANRLNAMVGPFLPHVVVVA